MIVFTHEQASDIYLYNTNSSMRCFGENLDAAVSCSSSSPSVLPPVVAFLPRPPSLHLSSPPKRTFRSFLRGGGGGGRGDGGTVRRCTEK